MRLYLIQRTDEDLAPSEQYSDQYDSMVVAAPDPDRAIDEANAVDAHSPFTKANTEVTYIGTGPGPVRVIHRSFNAG